MTNLSKSNNKLSLEYQITDRFGNERWVSERNVLITDDAGTPIAIEGIITDISKQKAIEQTLRKNEKRFLAATQHATAWIWEMDLDGIYTYMSPAIHDVLGYWPEEVTGIMNISDLLESSERERILTKLSSITVSFGVITNLIHYKRHRDGRFFCIKSNGVPIYDDDGRLYGYCGVDEDISRERKILENLTRSEEKFRLFVENSHDILFSLDSNCCFTYLSPKWFENLGYENDQGIGSLVSDFIHPDDYPAFFSTFLQVSKTNCKKSGNELRIKHKDGTWVWHTYRISSIYTVDGSVIGVHGIFYDISERKKTEETLQNVNRQLSLLTSITRHDILNKLTVILGLIQIAERDCEDSISLQYLNKILSATNEIRSQIEFTRIYGDIGLQELKWVELRSIIPTINELTQVRLINDLKNISILADPMIGKVFSNLFENSLNHGEYVTEISVSSHENEDTLIILWEDNGSGIRSDEKEKIFGRGFGKNTGLGMFLAREILALSKISIQEVGIYGKGARFEIIVPNGNYRINKEFLPETEKSI